MRNVCRYTHRIMSIFNNTDILQQPLFFVVRLCLSISESFEVEAEGEGRIDFQRVGNLIECVVVFGD